MRYFQKHTIVIKSIISDGEGALSKLETPISALGINIVLRTGRRDPLLERKLETIKSKVRSCIHSQPYGVLKFMLILMVCFISYCVNLVPTRVLMGYTRPGRISLAVRCPGMSFKRSSADIIKLR